MAKPSSTSALEQAKLEAILNGPAGTPPPGVAPNFDDPANLDTWVILTLTLAVTFATVAVWIRLYTKKFIIRSVAYEDYALLLGWVGEITQTIPSGLTTRHGGGTHIWNVQMKQFFKLLYWINISSIVYGPTIFFIKLSILLQYLRIFVPNRKSNMPMFIACQLCIWSELIFYLVDTVFEIATCNPREKIWNPLIPGHCFNQNAAFKATGLFNVLSDFTLLILPMPCLWRLQMPRKRKVLLTVTFATGSLACVTSILRTYYTWKIVESPDITYNTIVMGLWAYAEVSIGIFVSCFPIMPRFFGFVGPKIYSTLSLGSLSRTLLGHSQTSTSGNVISNRSLDSLEHRRPCSKRPEKKTLAKIRDDRSNSTTASKNSYITLSDNPADNFATNQGLAAGLKGSATTRDGFETGGHWV